MDNQNKFTLFRKRERDVDLEEIEDRTPTLKFFFKLLKRRLSGLITLNFIMILMILPLLAGIYLYVTSPMTPSTLSPLYMPLYGVSMITDAPSVAVSLSTVSPQIGYPVFSAAANVFVLVLGVVLILTWGLHNVASTYVLRGFFRGDPIFVFSDYWYAIKRNWKQGIVLGIMDLGIMVILVVDYIALGRVSGNFWNDLMYTMIVAIAVLYFFMRFYIYLMSVTFEMKLTKIFKNALIFTVLGIKRNLLAALGIILLVALHVLLIILFLPSSIPIILPFFYLLSVTSFMAVYAAYPVIDRYLIKPYEAPESADASENAEVSEDA